MGRKTDPFLDLGYKAVLQYSDGLRNFIEKLLISLPDPSFP